MATSPLPSSSLAASQTTPTAPPNFYAQAATAQPAAAPGQQASAEDTAKFRKAIEKLLTIFDKMEKLKPNGISVEKKIKSVAQSLKDLRNEVFEGEEGEGGDEDTDLGDGKAGAGAGAGAGTSQPVGAAASPPPVSPGGVPGTGA
jgi:soluble cytochrome b562